MTVRRVTSADTAVLGELSDSLARRDGDWRPASIRAGALLLSAVPDDPRLRALTIAPDGPIQFVPFDALTLPGRRTLAVERFAITYVPSAALLTRARPASKGWRWPWQRELVAFADPAPARYPIEARPMPPLPFAGDEVRRAARELGGASEIHAGADATKAFVRSDLLRDVPVVHFATHAVADTRDPDRSRVLLAPRPPARDADYLFLREIYDLDLSRVSLVTLSACDTARGKIVRGEGVEAFGRALVAAGAGSALTTLWPIADRPAAELMTQFYYHAGRGQPESEALRLAKLQFVRSRGAWAHPYFWAPYLLTGPADAGLPRVVRWWWLAAAGLVLAAAIAVALRAAARA